MSSERIVPGGNGLLEILSILERIIDLEEKSEKISIGCDISDGMAIDGDLWGYCRECRQTYPEVSAPISATPKLSVANLEVDSRSVASIDSFVETFSGDFS